MIRTRKSVSITNEALVLLLFFLFFVEGGGIAIKYTAKKFSQLYISYNPSNKRINLFLLDRFKLRIRQYSYY